MKVKEIFVTLEGEGARELCFLIIQIIFVQLWQRLRVYNEIFQVAYLRVQGELEVVIGANRKRRELICLRNNVESFFYRVNDVCKI